MCQSKKLRGWLRATACRTLSQWCLGSGLPQTQHVALGVLEVSEGAHAGDWGARRDRAATLRLDLLQGVVDAIDVDGAITGPETSSVRCIMPPLIAPGSAASGFARSHRSSSHSCTRLPHWHGLELPAKDGAVEILGSINVVGWNFEMHDLGPR